MDGAIPGAMFIPCRTLSPVVVVMACEPQATSFAWRTGAAECEERLAHGNEGRKRRRKLRD
jgi:hypothetical protein